MEKNLNEIEELDELKRNPFRTPENYFSKIETEFWQSISGEKEVKLTFSQRVMPSFAMGLSFVFVLLLGFGVIKLLTPQQLLDSSFGSELVGDDISQSIIDYLDFDQDIEDLDLDALYIEFSDEGTSISFDEVSIEDNISDDEIIEYLSMSMSPSLVYDMIENE